MGKRKKKHSDSECTVYTLHDRSNRVVLSESMFEINPKKSIIGLIAVPKDGEGISYLHIQRVITDGDFLTPIKGGLMLPIEYLPELKGLIDRMYLEALNNKQI